MHCFIRRSGENMRFRQTIFVGLVFSQLFPIMDEKHVIQQPKAYSFYYEKITFMHRVINAQ
jgi:hypothetical protein